MTDELLTRPAAGIVLDRAETTQDGRTVELRLLAWDEVADTPQGRESFRRGAFRGTDPTAVLLESQRHGGAIVGRGVQLEDRDDGAYLVGRISDTTAGRDLLTLVKDKVLGSASVTFVPTSSSRRTDGVIQRDRAELRRVAILPRGAYRSAGVLAVRTEVLNMAPDPIPEPTPVPDPPDYGPVLARMAAQDDALARLSAQIAGGPGSRTAHELTRFASFAEAYEASTTDPEVHVQLHRALVDQVTTDNPGLIPPAWLSEVAGLLPAARPGVVAFGGPAALPSTGMEFRWPVAIPPASPPIAVQTAEKTPITSVKVSFGSDQTTIQTYGGGSDLSWQLIRRSDPSYRELYARTMLSSYATVTDAAFLAVLAALTASTTAWDAVADTDGAAFVALLFAESLKVQKATGRPATAVVAAEDVFLALAGKARIVPPVPGPFTNALGLADARTLSVSVSGLPIVPDVNLAPGKFLVSNSSAARWHEDGPFSVQQSDVEKLGENWAYWGLGATAVYVPAGVVVGTATLPAPIVARSGRAS